MCYFIPTGYAPGLKLIQRSRKVALYLRDEAVARHPSAPMLVQWICSLLSRERRQREKDYLRVQVPRRFQK